MVDNKVLNNLYNMKMFLKMSPQVKELKIAIMEEDTDKINLIIYKIQQLRGGDVG